MSHSFFRFLGTWVLASAPLCLSLPALAQSPAPRNTPKVGINTRTPAYTLDVNGQMRVAVVEESNSTATHLLAIDKSTKQVVRTPISKLSLIKTVAKVLNHPATGEATFEFPTTDIDPQTQVAILLRANLRITPGDQVHNQSLLALADDPTKAADKRNTLMPAFVQYTPTGGPLQPTPLCGRVEGSNEQYQLKTSLGLDANNRPLPNTLMTTTKQVELQVNEAGTAYVFRGTFGRGVIAQNPGTLQWHLAILVFDKRWAGYSQQVVRIKPDGSLRNRDGSTYTPFYSTDPLRLSSRPKVRPIHLAQNSLTGLGTAGAQIKVVQRDGAQRKVLPTAVVNGAGDWSVPVSALTPTTIFEVQQVERVDGRDLPPSLVSHNIVRSHDPLATTDPRNPRVEQATQPAQSRVGIGTRTPEKTLDVVGNWGLHDAPPYPYEDALLLGVSGEAANQTIQRVSNGGKAVYTFTLAANNTNKDWIKALYLNRLNPNYTLVATRAAFSRSTRVNGQYHSFDEAQPELSGAYLSVSYFRPKGANPYHHTRNLIVNNAAFGITANGNAQGHFATHSSALAGGSLSAPNRIGALLFPNNKFRNPISLDYQAVAPMAQHLSYAWRVNYLAIRSNWMKQPITLFDD